MIIAGKLIPFSTVLTKEKGTKKKIVPLFIKKSGKIKRIVIKDRNYRSVRPWELRIGSGTAFIIFGSSSGIANRFAP